ncbi:MULTISPECIES: rhodanese-like domain-containing protein [Kamptonema]|uniref:rhodanese-like domain-containing protein n=1 Tax=Kamptonema TaxID=1501433 RepID=UPI0001DACABC|nr:MULTISPECIES: rhodanese-like domain-containing protein [Kamptonema]CBN55610.1 Rhodanese domain protein [Kamptonema sp. PCC 6506]
MRKFFLKLLMGTLLSIWILAIAPMPLIALSSIPQTQLSAAIDNFLNSLPGDYYTVMKIQDLKKIIARDNPLLIDVRQPAEYATGHIPNAINIPLPTLAENLDKIPKVRPVVLYCTTGYRTGMGVMTLEMLGYTNVRAFPPSIQGWKAAGEPLENKSI